MSGLDAIPLYNNWVNLYLEMRTFRGGGYDRIYGSATEEIKQCLRNLDGDEYGSVAPKLCKFLRKDREFLSATFGDKLFLYHTLRDYEAVDIKLPEPIYDWPRQVPALKSLERRLERTRHLTDETGAIMKFQQTVRTQILLKGNLPYETRNLQLLKAEEDIRKRFNMSRRANSALVNLLQRNAGQDDVDKLEKDNLFTLVRGCVTRFQPEHAAFLYLGGCSNYHTIDDIRLVTPMYLTSSLPCPSNFRIGTVGLIPCRLNKTKLIQTSYSQGLYQISESMYDWAEKKASQLNRLYEDNGKKPISSDKLLSVCVTEREWVNDDSAIVSLI